MKTLQELKNKNFKVERILTSMSIDAQKELLEKRLQPEEFCGAYYKHNKIDCIIINNKIVATPKEFYIYNCSALDKDAFTDNISFSDIECIYIEKINRYLITLKDFNVSIDLIPVKSEKITGLINFKSNLAYDFNGWQGDPLKKDDLIKDAAGNIIGFKKLTYKNEVIEYKFI